VRGAFSCACQCIARGPFNRTQADAPWFKRPVETLVMEAAQIRADERKALQTGHSCGARLRGGWVSILNRKVFFIAP